MGNLGRKVLAVVLFGVLLYGILFAVRGLGDMRVALRTYEWWTFGAACGLAAGNYFLRFLKWEFYLARLGVRGVPKFESLLVFLSGFVLTITPGKVGEVFKSLVLFELRQVPVAKTAPIVVAERVTDLIGIIALITVGSLSFAGGLVWATAGALLVLFLLLFVASERASTAVLGLATKLPGPLGKVGARIAPKVQLALGHLRGLTTPEALVVPTLLSIVAWSLEGVGLYVILRGFGVKPDLFFVTFCYATATLAGAIVPMPGGLGVTEKMIDEQLVRLGGIAGPTATSAMFLIRLATLWFAVIVGFAALGLLRASGKLGRTNLLEASGGPAPRGDGERGERDEPGERGEDEHRGASSNASPSEARAGDAEPNGASGRA